MTLPIKNKYYRHPHLFKKENNSDNNDYGIRLQDIKTALTIK